MPFNDALALMQARIRANQPQLAAGGNGVLVNLLQAFISAKTDTDFAIGQSSLNMFLATASGAALDAKALDYGVVRAPGVSASVGVVFSLPLAATSLVTIPAGMVIATQGDGISTLSVAYTTTAATTIAIGATASTSVVATANVPGVAGNVTAGMISLVLTPIGSGLLTVTNALAATGGVDPDTDAILRTKAQATISPKYGITALQTAILGAGAYDAYVFDPQNGLGTITYYYADLNGAQPGALTTAVATAVLAVLPANLLATAAAFTVTNFSAVSVHYSAGANVQTSTLAPLVQNAVAAYLQTLQHNQAPNAFGMSQFVNAATGYVLSYFALDSLNSLPPNAYAAANTTLYRMTGNPLSLVTATRI